jgi:pimeloyl-ACP methyl ester carboxylesterase
VATIGLVHGAYHGAACWARLIPELGALGLQARAMDLPSYDPDAGASAYAEAVSRALDDVQDELVLVGHSVGGVTIPLVAQMRPVKRLVFLCALLPEVGSSLRDQMAREPIEPGAVSDAEWVDCGGGTWLPAPKTARAHFYHDLPDGDAAWLIPQLRRQAPTPINEVSPLTRWPGCEVSGIICTDDRVVSPAWSRKALKDRLGIEPVELPGGHSPMVGRPAELARAIASLV